MGIRRRGVDVLTVPEAGTLGASDAKQLRRARDEGRVLLCDPRDVRLERSFRGLMLIHGVLEADEMGGRMKLPVSHRSTVAATS